MIIITVCGFVCLAQDHQEIKIANEYLNNGEKEKALEAFRVLSKNNQNIPFIHGNYITLLLALNQFKKAEEYLEKLIKKNNQITYRLDLGVVYIRAGELSKADKYLKNVIQTSVENTYKAKIISEYLFSQNLLDYSIYSLIQAREISKNLTVFSLELANLYRLQNKTDEMAHEYLQYATQLQDNISTIKNVLQVVITKPNEFESLENTLIQRIQQNKQPELFLELLIWTELQQKKFYEAYIQARAFDKKFKKPEPKTLEIAFISLNNKDYETAEKAFAFVLKEFSQQKEYFLQAQLGLIRTTEIKIKSRYPVNKDSVRYLITEYKKFYKQYPENQQAYEAGISQALLRAYYLNELDSAVQDLFLLIAKSRISSTLLNQAKLQLGDIYLLKEESWESTLLYSQVEKSQRESTIGYEAKLRNAKLFYYKGDFKLAQEHLDILKQATTREIANDAIDLSIKIKENTKTDSINEPLKIFASAELNLIQQKPQLAQAKWKMILEKYPQASIINEIYWQSANLKMKQGLFEESIQELEKSITLFPHDILSDDASFLQAEITEKYLKDKPKALALYQKFLTTYPASVYTMETRKRFRKLRGDFVEEKTQTEE